MARARKAKRVRKGNSNTGRFGALLTAATTMSCLGAPAKVQAQSKSEESEIRFGYAYYEDWQEGRKDRITVKTPMLWFKSPILDNTEIEGSLVYDAVSGASSLYLDTLSGASGTPIEDKRKAGDLTVTQSFDRFSIAVGGTFSTEDDYDALGGKLLGNYWTSDKNTTISVGVDLSDDQVGSSNNPLLDEDRKSLGTLVGVTQILDKNSLVQSNLTFNTQDGFLDDPYKPADHRPASRDSYAWLTRYVRYIEDLGGSLHADYRFYYDSWNVRSHTFALAWYQPLGEEELWMLRPSLRYYSQDEAEFYNDSFPPAVGGQIYTADQRLSSFGRISGGLKIIRELPKKFSAALSFEISDTSSGIKSFSAGSPGIDDLYYNYILFELSKRF